MRSIHFVLAAAMIGFAACSQDSRNNDTPTSNLTATSGGASHDRHGDNDIVFGPAPSVLPPGAEMAVLEGDPSTTAPFTVRLRLPNGYRLPAHTHPTRENVTVIQGTFLAGAGTRFDEAALQPLGQGAFLSIPENHAHFAAARGLTIVQVHALGPFALTYTEPVPQR